MVFLSEQKGKVLVLGVLSELRIQKQSEELAVCIATC